MSSDSSTRLSAPVEIKYDVFNTEQAITKARNLNNDEVAGILRTRREGEQNDEPNPGSAGNSFVTWLYFYFYSLFLANMLVQIEDLSYVATGEVNGIAFLSEGNKLEAKFYVSSFRILILVILIYIF